MNPKKPLLLTLVFIFLARFSLLAWTSSNEGVCYTMDTLTTLSPNINYNYETGMFEVHENIVILENDTLLILPGEIVKFIQYFTSYRGLKIYGNLIAIGTKDNQIILGDPNYNISNGDVWNGIQFINLPNGSQSILKYCTVRGAINTGSPGYESAIYCENSSPLIDHCRICYMISGEETGGGSGISCKGQSYPIVSYCTFDYLIWSIAIWCSPWTPHQDTINYPSPLIYGCNIKKSVSGFFWYPLDYDVVVYRGGFLDYCYLGVPFSNFPDTTLGVPIDTIGDGICNTTSTNYLKRFMSVDGVVNPRGDTLLTAINESETEILPTTTNHLVLYNNYPNPFSNFTTISFDVAKPSATISLAIYDSKGNLVREIIKDKNYSQGSYKVGWLGENDSGEKAKEGIYFYKLTSGGQMMVKKAIVVK
jgi:hypothetical protein